MDHGATEDLALELGRLLMKGMGARSKWALGAAIQAAHTEGIGGVCVLQIPSKAKDYIDITFTCGIVDVISRWGDSA